MSDSAKQYPVSDTKLKRLRSEGIVPVSRDLQTTAIIAGMLLGCFSAGVWLVDEMPQLLESASKVSATAELEAGREGTVRLLYELLVRALVPILIFAAFVGWYQTGFLIRLNGLRFDPSAIFSLVDNLYKGLKRRILFSFIGAMKVCLWFVVCFSALVFVFSDRITSISLPASSVTFLDLGASNTVEAKGSELVPAWNAIPPMLLESMGHAERLLFRVCAAGALFVLCLGLFGRLVVIWLYQHDHRMTRAEVEEENRETEQPPELQRAYHRSRVEHEE